MTSPGEQIVTALLDAPARRHFNLTLERKASPILGTPAHPMPLRTVAPGATTPLRLRDLIPGGTTQADSIGYARETGLTGAVVPIAPGGLKTQAGLTYALVTSAVRTIPAYMKASAQLTEDYAAFQSWIDTRLQYALALAEDNQLLNGNGVAPNLDGLLINAVPVTTVAGTGGIAVLDNVAAGIAAVFGFGHVPDGIVLNPGDWGKALTVKAVAGGEYLLGDPSEVEQPFSLWGIPLVLSPSMTSGRYLVGQFNPHCQLFDRDTVAVEVAEQNEDDFVRDLITVRAEERLALAIYQPGAFGKGTFTP